MAQKPQGKSPQEQITLLEKVQNSTRQVWLAGVGALSKSQEEGSELFDSLVKKGEEVEAQLKETAENRVADIKDRIVTTWDKVEQTFNERVSNVMHMLGVSTKEDVENLAEKVEEQQKEAKTGTSQKKS